MAVDLSKLRKPSRRRLGTPPTDGSPGIEDDFGFAPDDETQPAAPSPPGNLNRLTAPVNASATRTQRANALSPSTPMPNSVTPTLPSGPDHQVLNGTDEESGTSSTEDEGASTQARRVPATSRGRGEQPTHQGRQRVPPPAAEARIPFTTRVSVSTKERLEEACHYLRVKHQDFINHAIVAHLKKYGF